MVLGVPKLKHFRVFGKNPLRYCLYIFATFSNGDHLGFSTRLKYIILKPCSLIMLHVKFEISAAAAKTKSFE